MLYSNFHVLKVDTDIKAKDIEANWLVKQHLEEHKGTGSKPTYFVLENGDKFLVVSSYGEYPDAEPGQNLSLCDDGNRTTNFGRGRIFTIRAIITPNQLPTVVSKGTMKFYVCK